MEPLSIYLCPGTVLEYGPPFRIPGKVFSLVFNLDAYYSVPLVRGGGGGEGNLWVGVIGVRQLI